jgi:hypothetical protein
MSILSYIKRNIDSYFMEATGYYYEPEPDYIINSGYWTWPRDRYNKLISVDDPKNDITVFWITYPFSEIIHNDTYIKSNRPWIAYYRGEYYIIELVRQKLFYWSRKQFKFWLSKLPTTPIKNNTGRELIFISQVRDDAYHLMQQGYNMYVLNTRSSKILFGSDKDNKEKLFIDAENYEIISYTIYSYIEHFIKKGTYEGGFPKSAINGGSFNIDGDEYKIDRQLDLSLIVCKPYELYKFGDIYAVIIDYVRVSQLNRVNKRTKPAR